ncbi:glycosyl-4,4'-diaponeurosporenoate acyltransferase [Staphylococcus capitis]|uniref:glycosyl-4,4'-diaponeurosporenoate acyltransferase CrtO family protein n=1 Tax=Staphylococcus capitis TaxID=29388 RepID=UPI0034CFD7B6
MKAIKSITRLIILHSLFWFVVQMSIAHLGTRIPKSFFEKYSYLFRSFQWEENGELWDHTLKVSKWKRLIPEGAQINKDIYDKSKLSLNIEETRSLLLEMRRAELIHWISILPVWLFVKAPRYIKMINIAYVLFSHLPVIVAQRYNRPRIERLIRIIEKRGK